MSRSWRRSNTSIEDRIELTPGQTTISLCPRDHYGCPLLCAIWSFLIRGPDPRTYLRRRKVLVLHETCLILILRETKLHSVWRWHIVHHLWEESSFRLGKHGEGCEERIRIDVVVWVLAVAKTIVWPHLVSLTCCICECICSQVVPQEATRYMSWLHIRELVSNEGE